jgi:DNA-binding PadR family transcriptional regulator
VRWLGWSGGRVAGQRHGYAVKEALRAGSGARFDLPTGTIYPALRRLEAAGLVKGTWAEAGGRRRTRRLWRQLARG